MAAKTRSIRRKASGAATDLRAGSCLPESPNGRDWIPARCELDGRRVSPHVRGPPRNRRATCPARKLSASLCAPESRSAETAATGQVFFPFGTSTSRNAQAKSLFNAHASMRSFMRFESDKIGLYLDWRTQEVGIAAARSGDAALGEAYRAGDVYHALAVLCGLTTTQT